MKRTLIRILRENMAVAGRHCEPGDVMEVTEIEARFLIGRGWAEPVKDEAPKKKSGRRRIQPKA